ncbi:hypothetical protein JCM10449v2_007839 [Rhodotorula kratochvilovae]
MTGLHRRGSSAALYTPVHGAPGDITESFASATPRGRTGSFSADNTRPAKSDLEELEEKEAFIPTTRYDRPGSGGALGWRSVDAGSRRRRGAKCGWIVKLVLMALLGGSIGGAVWYVFLRDSASEQTEDGWLEAYKPGWWRSSLSSVVAEAESTMEAASGLKAEKWATATSALGDKYATATSKWSEATKAAYKGAYSDDDDYYTDDEFSSDEDDKDAELSISSSKDAIAVGTFSAATGHLVSQLLDNGTLAAYKWHETLPALGAASGSSLLSSFKKGSDGRLVVVGDLHGTYRSLLSLLKRLSFSPTSDTLLHVGDLVGKSPLNDSLATVALLRRLGARGVRGNHDQRVLEWRMWMEAYGPLDQSASSSAKGSAAKVVAAAVKGVQHAAAQGAQSGFSRAGKAAAHAESAADGKLGAGAAKLAGGSGPAPRARRERRGWMSWLTGGSNDDVADVAAESQAEVEDEFAAEEEYAVSRYGALGDDFDRAASGASSAASKVSSSHSKATETASSSSTNGGRRPFGRPTTLSSSAPRSSASSTRSSSSVRASATRAASAATPLASSSSYDSTGALTGASYAHLDPSLSPSQLHKLGLTIPDGWEWGGDHFEIARHLSSADAAYLAQLPLTLYVDELKSFVVHAGMVPWSSLDSTLARVAPSSSSSSSSSAKTKDALRAALDSTTPLSFAPSSALARLLARHSARTALLLEKLNTQPFTLLNMRSLTHAGGSAKNAHGVKGPAAGGEWSVSAKGRKAGKKAQPWWAVWEEGMKECRKRAEDDDDESGCEEVGVVYGHWAGQGLQVQDHSIGLDTGCVYGRRLSALVVPLSPSSSSPLSSSSSSTLSSLNSTLHNFTAPLSSGKNHTLPSAVSKLAASATSLLGSETARAKANWHGGMQRVKAPSSSSASASASSLASASAARARPTATAAAAAADKHASLALSDEFEDLDLASASPSASASTEAPKPWWRPWKRAPPQGRPGVAPWSSPSEEAAGEEAHTARQGEDYRWMYEEELAAKEVGAKAKGGKKLAAAAVEKAHKEQEEEVDADLDDAEEEAEVAELLEADEQEEDEDDDDEAPESAFAEEKVVLAQAGGKVGWVVSVDCAGEADIE